MISIPVYPLQWPEKVARAKNRGSSGFRSSLSAAITNARKSLNLFGHDTGLAIKESDIVFSSNFGGVGLEGVHRSNPSDPGVAVWFMWDGAQRCIAVDKYAKIEDNVQAIHHIVEAERTKLRHGGLEIVRAGFRGHIALPSPEKRRQWPEVLGFAPNAVVTADGIEAAYRRLAKERHPDKGGSQELMAELNTAREEALKAIGA